MKHRPITFANALDLMVFAYITRNNEVRHGYAELVCDLADPTAEVFPDARDDNENGAHAELAFVRGALGRLEALGLIEVADLNNGEVSISMHPDLADLRRETEEIVLEDYRLRHGDDFDGGAA